MTLETCLGIMCLIVLAVCGIGYRHLSNNVKLTYKDQRIPREAKK